MVASPVLSPAEMTCPIPLNQHPQVLMAHGGGGRLQQQLIEKLFVAGFGGDRSLPLQDAARLQLPSQRIAFTTDSYVVQPLFFPGGDIGSLAVHGTVNDLAMVGARPLYLSAGFILEEGLAMETLWRVVQSMQRAAEAAQVQIVTGDTKVVDRGKGDGIFINTAGVGVIETEQIIGPQSITVGDAILISRDLGCHGIAIMAQREGLAFESPIESDSAPLSAVVQALLDAKLPLHCMRDITRGGLASILNEIATAVTLDMELEAARLPIQEAVQGACELLGLDPLYIANEGCFVLFLPAPFQQEALGILQRFNPTAAVIGRVLSGERAQVMLTNQMGTSRQVDWLIDQQLPRIC